MVGTGDLERELISSCSYMEAQFSIKDKIKILFLHMFAKSGQVMVPK